MTTDSSSPRQAGVRLMYTVELATSGSSPSSAEPNLQEATSGGMMLIEIPASILVSYKIRNPFYHQ